MVATPVVVSTSPPLGGAALRVTANTEPNTEGGSAVPVYIVTDADVASGRWSVQGNITLLAMTAVTDGRAVLGQSPIPVYVAAGSFGGTPVPPVLDFITDADGQTITDADGQQVTNI